MVLASLPELHSVRACMQFSLAALTFPFIGLDSASRLNYPLDEIDCLRMCGRTATTLHSTLVSGALLYALLGPPRRASRSGTESAEGTPGHRRRRCHDPGDHREGVGTVRREESARAHHSAGVQPHGCRRRLGAALAPEIGRASC